MATARIAAAGIEVELEDEDADYGELAKKAEQVFSRTLDKIVMETEDE